MNQGTFGDRLGRNLNLMVRFSNGVSLSALSKRDLMTATPKIGQGDALVADGHNVALLKVTQNDSHIIASIIADRRDNVAYL